MKAPVIYLKHGCEKQLLRRHPWVFSGAVLRSEGYPSPGQTVKVRTGEGAFVAWGHYHPNSQLRVRLFSWEEEEPSATWLENALKAAVARRRRLLAEGERSLRLVFSEADSLPGLVADLLGGRLVLQSDTWGADAWVEPAASILGEALVAYGAPAETAVEKSDGDGRAAEGLTESHRVLFGTDGPWSFCENGLIFTGGNQQKTGHFTDQRDNRRRLAPWCRGARVLDGFCHTGGMGLNALAGGAASVLFVDSSSAALGAVQANLALNKFPQNRVELRAGDLFETLRTLRSESRRFDTVILDPPKFARKKEHRAAALSAYKDLVLQGLDLLETGGHLAVFCCSGSLSREDLVQACAFAAWDLRIQARTIEEYRQSFCHPVPLAFPQAAYLFGLLLQKGGAL